MNKDALILSFMVALVLAAGAVFFLFNQQEDDSEITPADVTPVTKEIDGETVTGPGYKPSRRKGSSLAEAASAGGPTVVADESLADDMAAALSGKVIDMEGAPIEGAVVALCVDVGSARAMSVLGEIRVAALTDAQGSYTIEGIPVDDRYAVRVEAQDFASRIEQALQLRGSETRRLNFQLSNGQMLKGLVVDKEGTPIPNAQMLISDGATHSADPELAVEKVAVTDQNGEFACQGLNPGMKKITCMAKGFGTQTKLGTQIIAGKETEPVRFELMPGGVTFTGRVIDEGDELAIEGVIVNAQPIRSGRKNISAINYPPVKTDGDGIFTMEGLQPGPYRMRFFGGKGYALAGTQQTVQVPAQENILIKLKRQPMARGRVVDAETGEPITRFKIHFARSENLVMASPQLSQKFEHENGEFEFEGVQTTPRTMKDFFLHATARGYAGGVSQKLQINGANDFDGVVIEMYRGAVVTGKVVDSSGLPVKNAMVELAPQMSAPGSGEAAGGLFNALIANGTRTTRRTARTNEKGEFRVEAVAKGWYRLEADHPQYADAQSEQTLEVGQNGDFEFLPVTLMKGARVYGRVLSKEGNPEKGSRVRVQSKGAFGGKSYSKMTDAKGRFELQNIAPGVYVVTVVERNGQVDLGMMFQQALNPPREIILGDGESMDLGDL